MVYVFLSFRASPPASTGKVVVFTSIVPQEYFVERIGGKRVEVQALVKPGSSPATYEPTPRQMAALSEARLYFRIGVPFENALLPNIEETMKGLRIVDTRRGITLRAMKAHHHSEGEDRQHNGGNDPHIWLNPRLVQLQVQAIAEALIKVDPDGKDAYKKNLAAFLKDLDGLDAKLAEALAPVKGKTFLVFHPAWGYFADAYGLEQEPIEIEGKEPSAMQLARIIEEAKKEGVRVIFVQPQFSQASAKQIAEAIGGAVVPIDPLARDYITNLEAVATKVGPMLEKQQ
jgi:zinc transport system substrate-binding protein